MDTMESEGYTPIDRAKAEELLAPATKLQAQFWDALLELEGALDGIPLNEFLFSANLMECEFQMIADDRR
jgi:hypothetical protein